MTKKIISIILVLLMALTLFSVTAFAADDVETALDKGVYVVDADSGTTNQMTKKSDNEWTVTIFLPESSSPYKFTIKAGENLEHSWSANSNNAVYDNSAYADIFVTHNSSNVITINNYIPVKITVTFTYNDIGDSVVSFFCSTDFTLYNVTYDPNAPYPFAVSNSIANGTTDPDGNFTVTSEKFQLNTDNYVQVGWWCYDTYTHYDFGEEITLDKDVTMYADWEEIVEVNIPFTKTVKKGGTENPAAADFELEILRSHYDMPEGDISDVTVTGTTVSTNGAKDYNAVMTITGPYSQVNNFMGGGFAVREVNSGLTNWTYSDAIYYILPDSVIEADLNSNNGPRVSIYPAESEYDTDLAEYIYYPDIESTPLECMTFENTYTKNVKAVTPPTSNNVVRENPSTGDMSPIELAGATIIVGAIAVAIAVINRKKEKMIK